MELPDLYDPSSHSKTLRNSGGKSNWLYPRFLSPSVETLSLLNPQGRSEEFLGDRSFSC